jgi:CRP-like cAMP-binding protein
MQPSSIPDNLLLRAARRARRPAGQLKHILFEAGEQLWRADAPIPYALFPLRGVISLQISTDRGKLADIALLGREGYAEVPFFLRAEQTRTLAVGLIGGEALVMPPDLFQAYLGDGRFRHAVERYMRLFLVMANQISLCNRVHVIEKTIIGRLLLMQDRTQTDAFQLTHAFFAGILGVRKATVSRVAAQLQQQGAIRYDRRGRLTILDRRQLEKQACSCYHAIKSESENLIAALGGF